MHKASGTAAIVAAVLVLLLGLSHAVNASPFTSPVSLVKRQSYYNAYWYSKCAPLYQFLSNHGVAER